MRNPCDAACVPACGRRAARRVDCCSHSDVFSRGCSRCAANSCCKAVLTRRLRSAAGRRPWDADRCLGARGATASRSSSKRVHWRVLCERRDVLVSVLCVASCAPGLGPRA
eukprot:Amastigsp_a850344_8.p4 type:complete len:111 gc:universal Amastigsp_a850344_8:282-614(+)